MKKLRDTIRNIFAVLGMIAAAVMAVMFGTKKSTNEKISKIESEAENEVNKMDIVGIVNYLNSVLASRRKTRR
jgi:regulatory protein YycI of two-component signal transduction system YycFG